MTVLTPGRVPWMVAPSMGCVTLQHAETDTEPECKVVFAGGRMTSTGKMDLRRIEIEFDMCSYSRTLPLPGGGIEAVYRIEGSYEGDASQYLKWLERRWRTTGLCPRPGFYAAVDSERGGVGGEWQGRAPRYKVRRNAGAAEAVSQVVSRASGASAYVAGPRSRNRRPVTRAMVES